MTSVEQRVAKPGILTDHAQKFSIKGIPLLSQGTQGQVLGMCESLWIHSKVYCEGGENTLHAHFPEDHAFFVLGGRAMFYDKDDVETEVGPLEGITIPRGVFYRFQSIPPDNLVILRIGGAEENFYDLVATKTERIGPDGSPLVSTDPRSHPGIAQLPAVASGARFGE